jgi:hypothetical protein
MHAMFMYMGVSDNKMNMKYKTYARHVMYQVRLKQATNFQ